GYQSEVVNEIVPVNEDNLAAALESHDVEDVAHAANLKEICGEAYEVAGEAFENDVDTYEFVEEHSELETAEECAEHMRKISES
ncbi:hypothetical protein PFISCL1PPCAC_3366, partial [Pristionchus fissidentatus]